MNEQYHRGSGGSPKGCSSEAKEAVQFLQKPQAQLLCTALGQGAEAAAERSAGRPTIEDITGTGGERTASQGAGRVREGKGHVTPVTSTLLRASWLRC